LRKAHAAASRRCRADNSFSELMAFSLGGTID